MPVRVSEHDAGRENESYSKEVLHQYIRVKLSSQDSRTTEGRRALGGHELRGRVAKGLASMLWDTCKTHCVKPQDRQLCN